MVDIGNTKVDTLFFKQGKSQGFKPLCETKSISLQSESLRNPDLKVNVKLMKNKFQSFTFLEISQKRTTIFILYSRLFLTLGQENFRANHLAYPIYIDSPKFVFDNFQIPKKSMFDIIQIEKRGNLEKEHKLTVKNLNFVRKMSTNSDPHELAQSLQDSQIQVLRKLKDYNRTLLIVRLYKDFTLKNMTDEPLCVQFNERNIKMHELSTLNVGQKDSFKIGLSFSNEGEW